MMKKTVLQILLLTLCLLLLLASCKDKEKEPADTGATEEITTEAPTEEATTAEKASTGPVGDDEEGKYNGLHPA